MRCGTKNANTCRGGAAIGCVNSIFPMTNANVPRSCGLCVWSTNACNRLDKLPALVCHINANRQDGLLGEKLSAEDVRQLYARHGPALVAYACTLTADSAAAED